MEEFKRTRLFNKLEYVALFRLNRPIQTIEESVDQFKRAKNNFNDLVRLVQDSNAERELHWAIRIQNIINNNQEKISHDQSQNRLDHLTSIDRARRANRTMLADAISVVNNEYSKMKAKEIENIQKAHDNAKREALLRNKECRTDIIHKNDAITKLKNQMVKMQGILRKNGLVSESSDAQNNSGNFQTMIESLKQAYQDREDKIKSLVAQVTRLQSMPRLEKKRGSSIFSDLTEVSNDNINQTTITFNSRRNSSMVSPSISGKRGSMMREKRASISLRGLQSTKKESLVDLPPAEIKQTVQEKLIEITDKYQHIISNEKNKHALQVQAELESMEQDEELYKVKFRNELSFSTKNLTGNKAFQKYSIELLDNIQGLFPIRIHPTKVSSYTQCDLDDLE